MRVRRETDNSDEGISFIVVWVKNLIKRRELFGEVFVLNIGRKISKRKIIRL